MTTIVLLPGLICDSGVWQAQIPALSALAPVRVADFSRHDSLAAMARSVLDQVTGPLIVIGHSMGGRAALELYRLAPERVEKLALLDTGVHPRAEGELEKRQALVGLANREGMGALAEAWLPPMVHPDRVRDAALMDPLRAMVLRATPQQHARQIKALLDRPDAAPLLPTITCPTLVLVGRQDAWSPPAQHQAMAAQIKDARYLVIEESGHMTPAERPEAVTAALLELIAR